VYDPGTVGELELLRSFDGDVVIPTAVVEAVDVQPAATTPARFLDAFDVATEPRVDPAPFDGEAQALLHENRPPSDCALVAALLAARDEAGTDEFGAGVATEDRRLRALADGLGATVTGTFGVVVRARVDDKYFSTSQAKRVIRRIDQHGLQSTGPLRSQAVGAVDANEASPQGESRCLSLGNRTASLMLSRSSIVMTRRSAPSPQPAWGGIP
jgi:predicted nucleic acid-binding protein